MDWVNFACQQSGIDGNNPVNLKNQLGNCFQLIRFGAMDGNELTTILSNELYDQLFTREELKDVLLSSYHLHPSQNYKLKQPESTWFSTNEPILLNNTKHRLSEKIRIHFMWNVHS